MITIIDYGMGNLGSINNMLKRIGVKSVITSDIKEIENSDKIILPGVGSFDNGMKNIKGRGILSILEKKVLYDKIPILGICLGMQLFMDSSEEGNEPGLGWIAGKTVKFTFNDNKSGLKVPHMGWNEIKVIKDSTLSSDFSEETRFYFVHSYYVSCFNYENVLMRTHYGFDFDSAVQKENIYGVQFHPEKSHKFGMKLMKNFLQI